MKITIKVTKEILRKSMMCATDYFGPPITENCAIALAVREIAPTAIVTYDGIVWIKNHGYHSQLNSEIIKYIKVFDRLNTTPEIRLDLPEISFEVDFPDELVERIGIEEVRSILSKSETLAEAV